MMMICDVGCCLLVNSYECDDNAKLLKSYPTNWTYTECVSKFITKTWIVFGPLVLLLAGLLITTYCACGMTAAVYSMVRSSKSQLPQERQSHRFLGAFAKLRKATISFVMTARLSVHPHGTTGLSLDGLSWDLIFEYFSKICRENPSLIKMWQE